MVCIQVNVPCRDIYNNDAICANDASVLECHIETEEANAMNLNSLSKIIITK